MTELPPSVRILREQGPMSLRNLTSKTAMALETRLDYDDVHAVMRRSRELGEVRVAIKTHDYRDTVWEATS